MITIEKVNKLKELFLKNNINKVVFQESGLFIEYNNNNNFVGKNEAEFSQWEDFNREFNQKEISWETLNNYNLNPNHNNLPTILTVGAILILGGGLITYFLTRKKQKIN